MSDNTQIEVVSAAGVATPTPMPTGPDSLFEAAWNAADMDDLVKSQATPFDSGFSGGTTGSSVLSLVAQQVSQVMQAAQAPPDIDSINRMSAIQSTLYMTQRQIDSNYATALLDTSWAVLKHTRQSLDTVMNSK